MSPRASQITSDQTPLVARADIDLDDQWLAVTKRIAKLRWIVQDDREITGEEFRYWGIAASVLAGELGDLIADTKASISDPNARTPADEAEFDAEVQAELPWILRHHPVHTGPRAATLARIRSGK